MAPWHELAYWSPQTGPQVIGSFTLPTIHKPSFRSSYRMGLLFEQALQAPHISITEAAKCVAVLLLFAVSGMYLFSHHHSISQNHEPHHEKLTNMVSTSQVSPGHTATEASGPHPRPTRNGSPVPRASYLRATFKSSRPTAPPAARPGTPSTSATAQPTS